MASLGVDPIPPAEAKPRPLASRHQRQGNTGSLRHQAGSPLPGDTAPCVGPRLVGGSLGPPAGTSSGGLRGSWDQTPTGHGSSAKPLAGEEEPNLQPRDWMTDVESTPCGPRGIGGT